MKTINSKKNIFFMSVIFGVLMPSCSDDGKNTPDQETGAEGKYILMADVEVSDQDTSSYILTIDDLMTGTISSAGQGIETTATNAVFTNNKLFAFGDNCDVYDYAEGKLTKNRSFAYDTNVSFVVDEAKNIITGFTVPDTPGAAAKIQSFDTSEGFVLNSVDTPFYVPSNENPEEANYVFAPTSAYLDNNKLYVPHIVWDLDNDWEYPNRKKSYISVYSYPELKYEKTITSVNQGGSIGAWYDQPCHLQTENGDHYFMIPNVSNPATRPDVNSGFVRIKAGQEEFDTTYEYDVETPTGYRCFAGAYVSDNLAVVRVASDKFTESLWWSETPVFNIAIINLVDKTFKLVDDVPLHFMQYYTRFLVEDDKVYSFISTPEGNYVYRIDPFTATAKKGAKLEVSDIYGMFKTK